MATAAETPGTARVSIQEVSRRSGLSEPTLRYYERIGLIGPVPRDGSSGHRRYDPAAVERIEALGCLRASGMSVRDMRAYLDYLEEGDGAAYRMRDLFRRNAERMAEEVERMRTRQRYLALKADLWDARERGDADAERRAVEEIRPTAADLR